MMHRTKRAHHRPLSNGDVAAKGRSIGQNDMVADITVVCDVGVGHNQYMASHARQAAALDRTAVDGDKLTNLVVVTNLEAGPFSGVGEVLRRHTYRAEGKEAIV